MVDNSSLKIWMFRLEAICMVIKQIIITSQIAVCSREETDITIRYSPRLTDLQC